MLISNIFNETDLQLMMDGTILKIVEIDKHLGVYLSSNNKWSKHTDSIIASASKQIPFMRKNKYKFQNKHLTLFTVLIFVHCLNMPAKLGMDVAKQTQTD